jgi:lipopolysaccharide export system permease protein
MMEKLLKLSRFLSGLGTSMIDMAKIILYLQPQLFLLTLPMSLLLSTLLVYGRLNLDSELVILKNSGMDFKGISLPVFVVGLVCFIFNTAVSFYIGPKSSIQLRQEVTNIIKVRTPLAITEGGFHTSFKDMMITVEEKTAEDRFKGIFIYDGRNKNDPKMLIAKEGKIFMHEDFRINFYLHEGYIHMGKANTTTELFFKKYNMVLNLESDTPSKKNAEYTPYEIIQNIKKTQKRSSIINLYLELHRRLSLPFLCIILIFFGPPLSMIAGKSGRLGGLTLGLTVFTAYYTLLIYCENLVKAGKIEHYIGAWIPTVIISIIALFLVKKESSR